MHCESEWSGEKREKNKRKRRKAKGVR